jgi:hypothetical protein
MDPSRFDALTASLVPLTSRRRVLLGMLTLGRLLIPADHDAAAAGKRLGGAPCAKGSQCKTGKCLSTHICSCSKTVTCTQPANPCQTATCGVRNRCVTTNQTGPCNGDGICQDGQCVARCTPGTLCRDSSCQGTTLINRAICASDGTCPDSTRVECQGSNPCELFTCDQNQTGAGCFSVYKAPGTLCGLDRVCCSGTCCPAGVGCNGQDFCCVETQTCESLNAACGRWPGDCGTIDCGGCGRLRHCVDGFCR